jgi:protein tyrosine phosphatase
MNNLYLILLIFLGLLILMGLLALILSLTKKYDCLDNKKNYAEIIPNLFIGNIVAAQDMHFIKNNNIKVIINATNDIPNFHIFDDNLEYYRLPVDDSLDEYDINKMSEYLNEYVLIIDNALKNNKPVFVHCYAGRQRSAALIAAYLMYKYNYTIQQAYDIIIKKRPEAFHYGTSFNFNKSLLNYQNNLVKV